MLTASPPRAAHIMVNMATVTVGKMMADTIVETKKPIGIKYGMLSKCSYRFKRWKQFWFVLDNKDLMYYDNDQFESPKVISLKSPCSVLEADVSDTKRAFSFKVAVQKRTFVLSAETRGIMEDWIYSIRAIAGLNSPCIAITQLGNSTPSEQATQLLESTQEIIALCSKLIRFASTCTAPGVSDLPKLSTIADAAIKCAASVRAVIQKPNVHSAQQQFKISLSGIRDHSEKFNEFLGMVMMSSKKDAALDALLKTSDELLCTSSNMLLRCGEPETPTAQENIISVAREANVSVSLVLRAARESDAPRLVEASKDVVAHVTTLYNMAKSIMETTGHEQPRVIAQVARDLVHTLISRAKAYISGPNSDLGMQLEACTLSLQEKVSSIITAALTAEQQFLLEQQLGEATTTIEAAANEVFPVADRLSRRSTLLGRTRGGTFSEAPANSAKHAIEVIAASRTLASAIANLPGAVKALSRSTLFQVAKGIGTATNGLVQIAENFATAHPSSDPNFQVHLKECIQMIKSAGIQLMAMAKTVIIEEFKNHSDLLQLSGMARTHALGVAHILEVLKIHITPKSALSHSMSFKELSTPRLGRSVSSSPLSSLMFPRSDSAPSNMKNLQAHSAPLLGIPRSNSSPSEHQLFASHHQPGFAPRNSNSARHLLDLLLDDEDNNDMDKNDVNIWNEPADSEENIIMGVDESGEKYIKAATLNKLILNLTTENDHALKFQKTFIATYRSFTTPLMLFKKLIQRYNVTIPKLHPSISATEYHKKSVLPIQVRVSNVIKQWVETAFHDMNDNLIKRILDFTEAVLVADNHIPLARQIRAAVDKQLRMRETATNPILEAVCKGQVTDGPSADLSTYSEEEIALQLTIIDFNIYARIKPVELLNQSWNKESLKHRAPNVLAMIARFNAISNWAASVILWQLTIKERVAMYVRLVAITEHLFKLNNFNTALAIIAGLNSSGIFRLKYTRAELPKKIQGSFDNAMQLMNSEGSYKAYRDSLHNVNPPCVPYLGVYLTDLTFIEDGNKDFNNNLINFRKRQLVYDVIAEMQLHQQLPYNIKHNECLLSLLKNLPFSKEDQLYQLSLLREPRNAERADIA